MKQTQNIYTRALWREERWLQSLGRVERRRRVLWREREGDGSHSGRERKFVNRVPYNQKQLPSAGLDSMHAARMRSEGYSTWSVCLSVCLFVCFCLRLFSDYRLRGGLRAIPTASVVQGHEKQCGDFAETTAFERYGVKTSEKANMHWLTSSRFSPFSAP